MTDQETQCDIPILTDVMALASVYEQVLGHAEDVSPENNSDDGSEPADFKPEDNNLRQVCKELKQSSDQLRVGKDWCLVLDGTSADETPGWVDEVFYKRGRAPHATHLTLKHSDPEFLCTEPNDINANPLMLFFSFLPRFWPHLVALTLHVCQLDWSGVGRYYELEVNSNSIYRVTTNNRNGFRGFQVPEGLLYNFWTLRTELPCLKHLHVKYIHLNLRSIWEYVVLLQNGHYLGNPLSEIGWYEHHSGYRLWEFRSLGVGFHQRLAGALDLDVTLEGCGYHSVNRAFLKQVLCTDAGCAHKTRELLDAYNEEDRRQKIDYQFQLDLQQAKELSEYGQIKTWGRRVPDPLPQEVCWKDHFDWNLERMDQADRGYGGGPMEDYHQLKLYLKPIQTKGAPYFHVYN
jgi:hypothetical protein